jgi:hypothetical protein
MTKTYTIEATQFDICYSDYVTDWTGIVVGVERGGQTLEDLIEQATDEAYGHDDMPCGDSVYEKLEAAITDAIGTRLEGWRFWPVDDSGNEIRDEGLCVPCEGNGYINGAECAVCSGTGGPGIPEEQPSMWFRVVVTSEPMVIRLSNSDDDDGAVLVMCDDPGACDDDQTIDGSSWETPSDMSEGYTMLQDRPSLVAELEAQGYEVDDSGYSAPDDEDMRFWYAKCEASNDMAPETLREVMLWSDASDVAKCRRVSEQSWRWSDGPGPRAIGTYQEYVQACWDAGLPLDEWAYPAMRRRSASEVK